MEVGELEKPHQLEDYLSGRVGRYCGTNLVTAINNMANRRLEAERPCLCDETSVRYVREADPEDERRWCTYLDQETSGIGEGIETEKPHED